MKSLPNFIIVGPIDIFCKQKHFDLTKTTKIGWSTVTNLDDHKPTQITVLLSLKIALDSGFSNIA